MTLHKALRHRWISESLFENWVQNHSTSIKEVVRSQFWARMLICALAFSMLSSFPVALFGMIVLDSIVATVVLLLLLVGSAYLSMCAIMKPRFCIHNDLVFAIDFLRRELMFRASDKLEFESVHSRAQTKLTDLAYLVLNNEQVLDDLSTSYEERIRAGKDREQYKEAFNSLHGVFHGFGVAEEKDVYYAAARKRLAPTIH